LRIKRGKSCGQHLKVGAWTVRAAINDVFRHNFEGLSVAPSTSDLYSSTTTHIHTMESTASESTGAQPPVTIVCVGMAGSGKTTFMQRINSHLHSKQTPPYVLNLDPAVRKVPFDSNIDIRDSVNYREVMKQYNLGPNGGILTSLNLFATKSWVFWRSAVCLRCKKRERKTKSPSTFW
jgi:GTPase SAR1 family protein